MVNSAKILRLASIFVFASQEGMQEAFANASSYIDENESNSIGSFIQSILFTGSHSERQNSLDGLSGYLQDLYSAKREGYTSNINQINEAFKEYYTSRASDDMQIALGAVQKLYSLLDNDPDIAGLMQSGDFDSLDMHLESKTDAREQYFDNSLTALSEGFRNLIDEAVDLTGMQVGRVDDDVTSFMSEETGAHAISPTAESQIASGDLSSRGKEKRVSESRQARKSHMVTYNRRQNKAGYKKGLKHTDAILGGIDPEYTDAVLDTISLLEKVKNTRDVITEYEIQDAITEVTSMPDAFPMLNPDTADLTISNIAKFHNKHNEYLKKERDSMSHRTEKFVKYKDQNRVIKKIQSLDGLSDIAKENFIARMNNDKMMDIDIDKARDKALEEGKDVSVLMKYNIGRLKKIINIKNLYDKAVTKDKLDYEESIAYIKKAARRLYAEDLMFQGEEDADAKADAKAYDADQLIREYMAELGEIIS